MVGGVVLLDSPVIDVVEVVEAEIDVISLGEEYVRMQSAAKNSDFRCQIADAADVADQS